MSWLSRFTLLNIVLKLIFDRSSVIPLLRPSAAAKGALPEMRNAVLTQVLKEFRRSSQTLHESMPLHHSYPCNRTVAQLQEQIDRLNSVLGNAPNQMLSKSTSKCSIVAPAAYQPTAIPPSLPAHSSTSSHSDNTLMSTWGGHGPSETNSPVPPLPPLLSRDSVSLSDNHPVPVTDLSETFPTSRRIGEVTIDGREVDELFTMYAPHS